MEPPVPLEELLQAESAWVEWKEAGDRLAVIKTLVAFANDENDSGRGGYAICGIEETKDAHGIVQPNVVGLSQGERTGLKQRVLEGCANDVSPPLAVTVREVAMDADPSRAVVIFFVAASEHVHEHQTEKGSKVWVRRDSSTREIKREALRHLRLRKGEITPYLEEAGYNRARGLYASLDDIDMTVANEFRRMANLLRPMADYFVPQERIDPTTPSLCVEKQVGPGQTAVVPTNLAILLFGYEPARFVHGAFVEVALFPGSDIRGPVSVKEDYPGPLVTVIRDIRGALRGHMGILIDKSRSSFEIRQNRPRYSDKAIQEAIMNAFAHRDYELREPIRIKAFSDRIEIASPGGLVTGTDERKLHAGEIVGPRWRNTGLSKFLTRMSFGVQAMGQGIPTIFQETVATAEHPPEYEIDATQVKVTIPAYRPEPISPRAPPSPRPSPSPNGKDALVLVSIGSTSIRTMVETSLTHLGLEDAEVFMDVALPDYVDPEKRSWESIAKQIRNEFGPILDNPTIGQLHLFYRGPVVFAPLLGALVANAKPLAVYYHEKGKYRIAYTINTRFLKSRD
jgi:ATP-dependent DNA helicase RecG